MKNIDKAFLNSFIQFGFFGHIVSTIGLYESGKDFDKTASLMRFHSERIDYDTASKKANELNDGSRVQSIIIAKLFAEWVSSMEDFGALCWSIQNRNSSSILKKYADSKPSDVSSYFRLVQSQTDLHDFLNIPTLSDLIPKCQVETVSDLKTSYKNCTDLIKSTADLYLAEQGKFTSHLNNAAQNNDVIYIVLNVYPPDFVIPNDPRPQMLVKVYNKIKHRFLVFDSIEEMLHACSDNKILYTTYPRHPEKVAQLLQLTVQTAKFTAEVASLLIFIDANKISI